MHNRRHFLQSTLALSAACSVATAASACPVPGLSALRPALIVYDRRFEAARVFARAAARRAVAVRAIEGDVTALWYEDLSLRWRDPSVTVAGLTDASAQFCLQQLARPERRVVWRGEHLAGRDGRLLHTLQVPEAMIGRVEAQLASAGIGNAGSARDRRAPAARAVRPGWPAVLAELLLSLPAARGTRRTLQLSGPADLADTPPGLSGLEEPLLSWLIAPRHAPLAAGPA